MMSVWTDTELRIKQLPVAVTGFDAPRRRLTVKASVEELDRDDELILVDGIETDEFMLNPIFLLGHDHHVPIGHVTRTWVTRLPGGTKALMGEVELLPPGVSAAADQAWAEIVHGTRRGISIGFLPLESGPPILPGQVGKTFRRVQLYEISSVAIPSCARCVVTATKSHKETCAMPTCTCQQKDFEVSAGQMAAIPQIARQSIEDALGARRDRDELEIDEAVYRRGMQALPQIIREAVSEVIGGEVATALNRLRGRVD
jgi:hypothetical protein